VTRARAAEATDSEAVRVTVLVLGTTPRHHLGSLRDSEASVTRTVEAALDSDTLDTKTTRTVEAALDSDPLDTKTTRTVEAALDSDPLDTKTTRTVEAALDSDPLDTKDDADRRGGT
jgi:FlaG/FlaF family flagellin (archaellin)